MKIKKHDRIGRTLIKKSEWKGVSLILLGNLLYALTVRLFLVPSGIVTSGVTGMGMALAFLTKISMSTYVLLFNVILLAIGWIFLGTKFALTTTLSTFSYPLFLSLIEKYLGNMILTDDLILNTIFAGIGTGVSLGIVMRQGSSTGGMDVPPLVLNKYYRIPVAVSMYFFDFLILLAQCMLFPKEKLLYGIVNMIIYTIVLDKMIILGTSKTEIKVVSQKHNEIRESILNEADRGVTILHGEGGYLRNDSEIILTVISNRELPNLERIIHAIDPEAFMIINRISEVRGRGFTIGKEYQ